MSATYNLEPTPTAKVLLHTTAGDLQLELFAQQTPVTSRNFVQLCLDGYYDNTVFHRLVPGFVLQGGDPTGTGHGGESSYDGAPFADEFHSRLKYTRRGLLGMANTGKPDDNGSQFFLTLAATPELQGKNTLFGRVAGDTIYNLMAMAEADLRDGTDDQPMYPTRITGTDVLVNPFADMVRRVRIAQRTAPEEQRPKKPKRKAGKNALSFGDDDAMDSAPLAKKPKYNTKLLTAHEPLPTARAMPIRKPARTSPSPSPSPTPVKAPPKPAKAQVLDPQQAPPPPPPPPPREVSPASEKASKLDRVNAQIAELKASMKRSTGAQGAEPVKKKSLLEAMVPASTTRGRKRGTGGTGTAQEQATLDILSRFKSKLETAELTAAPRVKSPTTLSNEPTKLNHHAGPADVEEEACDLHFIVGCQSCTAWDKQDEQDSDDDAGWMAHSLSFAKDRLGKDLEWKRKNEEDLVVIDPLEEAKRHRADAKGKKRAWDASKGKAKVRS
ncbi:Peptidyl-prolyl isomerase cwc27 [Pleosporales sp. CAS-2024a]